MAGPWEQYAAPPPAPASTPAGPWGRFTEAPAAPSVEQPPAAPPSFMRSLGVGTRDALEGIAGPVYNLAGAPFRAVGIPVNTLGENLDALGLPKAETDGEKMRSAIIQPVAGSLTGQGVGRLMAGAGNAVVQGVGNALAAQPVTQAVSAGVGGAVGEATGSPMAGLAAGMATPVAGALLGAAVSPNMLAHVTPARAAAIATAEQEGIPLTIAQMTGGRVARNFESTLANLPGSSGVQARVNEAQSAAYNRAGMARTGTPSDTALPHDLQAAAGRIGQTYNDLTARNTVQVDPQFLTTVRDTAAGINRYIAESDRGPLMARVEDVVNAIDNGAIPGRTYQNLYSALGDDIRSSADGKVRLYLGQLRDGLRDAMDRSISPQDQAAWQQVRGEHGALVTIRKAMNQPSEGTALGNISPARLAQASNNQRTSSFANGRGNMDDLSRLGQIALKQTVPDSGTSQRNLMTGILTGGALTGAGTAAALGANPLLAMAAPAVGVGLPYLASQAYHSNAMRQYLMNDLAAGLTPRLNPLLGTNIGVQNQADRLRDR